MTHNWNNLSLTGCLFDAEPVAGPSLQVPSLRLPDRVDLRAHCSPIEHQLHTNSCVANAVVGALEFHQRRARQPTIDLSRLFVYYNARALAEKENEDCGSYIHHGMAALLAHGACEERMWPFLEAMVKTKPTMGCFKNASYYEAVQYARTPLGVPALAAISQGLPVVFGTYIPMDYYHAGDKTGIMPGPGEVVQTQPPSGHAMLMVGYDMTEKAWLVRNSWGAGFADGGYVWIPFDTLEAWSDATSFWTIGAIEAIDGFSLVGPQMTAPVLGGADAPEEAGTSGISEKRQALRSELSGRLDASKSSLKDRQRGK